MRHGIGTFIDGLVKYQGSWVEDAMDGDGVYLLLFSPLHHSSCRLLCGQLKLKMVQNSLHRMSVNLRIIPSKGRVNILGRMVLHTLADGMRESLKSFFFSHFTTSITLLFLYTYTLPFSFPSPSLPL